MSMGGFLRCGFPPRRFSGVAWLDNGGIWRAPDEIGGLFWGNSGGGVLGE